MRNTSKFINYLSRRPRLINLLHTLNLAQPDTGTIESELAALERYAADKRVALEIGTYQGVSAARIAGVLADGGKLFCIDPWIELEGKTNPCWSIAMRHFKRLMLESRMVILRDFSMNVQEALPEKLDFSFIDGDHSWAGLETDWKIVSPRIETGGILCLHDVFTPAAEPWRAPESCRFFAKVIALDQSFELIETVHSMAVLRKR